MNRLNRNDLCTPIDWDEYLMIHKLLSECGVTTLRTLRQRVVDGCDGAYIRYPSLYWDSTSGMVCGCSSKGRNSRYDRLSVGEFLAKAGVSGYAYVPSLRHKRIKYNNGQPLKHCFV